MKKKIKYRLRNDLIVPFWIAVLICVFGAAISATFFYKSFFRALSKLNELPIATITFKYKTAQRKFIDRVVWDRLRQNSEVYNGDTIHTSDLSEATVWFDDGTVLDLSENTMVQIFLHDNGTLAAELGEGSATVDSSENSAGVTITAANISVDVKAGSKLFAQKSQDNKNIILNVEKGNASLESGGIVRAGEAVNIDDEGRKTSVISMLSPVPSSKILYFTENEYPLNFEWTGTDFTKEYVIKISTDKDFNNVVNSLQTSGINNLTVNLQNGTYYWKMQEVSDSSIEEDLCSGKFQLIQSLKPELVAPVADYKYNYRKKKPAVRFIWSESPTATAYNFVVADNPDLRNPVIEQRTSSSSSIISTLGQGKYYWSVTPFYTINKIGLANQSEVGSFIIEQRGELESPVLMVPADGSFVDRTQQKGTIFSWRSEPEASTYKLRVGTTKDFRNAIIEREVTTNYINISYDMLQNLATGQYFWNVVYVDSEGNSSPVSETREFYALNGTVEQRTVFPPDGYNIWLPLLTDTRFTWKTNILLNHTIQISTDERFRNIVFEGQSNSSAFSGVNLDVGTYYWRVVAKDSAFEAATQPKVINIVKGLDAPMLIAPTSVSNAVVRPGIPFTFKWTEVDGAEYYRIKIYDTSGEKVLIDENFIEGTSFELNMDKYPEGYYKWDIQAFANENEGSTRLNSSVNDSRFYLRIIRPVVLKTPTYGTQIDGWTAKENDTSLTWLSYENFADANLVLRKLSGTSSNVVEEGAYIYEKDYKQEIWNRKGNVQSIGKLSSGEYEWCVIAETPDGYDISSEEPFRFEVLPIEPFAAPANPKVINGPRFNKDYIIKSKKENNGRAFILFEWDSVYRASDYIVEIYDSKKNKLLSIPIYGKDNTQLKFEELDKLYTLNKLDKDEKGKYYWSVKAVSFNEEKTEIFIDGNPTSEQNFEINSTLKQNGGIKKESGGLYGTK